MAERFIIADVKAGLAQLEDASVQTVVTSPPYWGLRDYGTDGQLGLESTHDEYVANLVAVFTEVWRVLRKDGTLWLNLGDSYAGSWGGQSRGGPPSTTSTLEGTTQEARTLSQRQIEQHPKTTRTGSACRTPGLKPKDLVGIPWRVAFALQAAGWYLRSDIIWSKPNPMPESVTDRPTNAHEYVFLLTKARRYFYNAESVREKDGGTDHARTVLDKPEPSGGLLSEHSGIRTTTGRNGSGRNRRTVWEIPTQPYSGAHFATFPEALVVPCILAGSAPGDTVLDPFFGSGTVAAVCRARDRDFIGIDLDPRNEALAQQRLAAVSLPIPWRTEP